jgi:hypothetical protein
MRFLTFLILLYSQIALGQAAPFRGATGIEEIITERITGTDHPFTFYRYMVGIENPYSMRQLLGVYSDLGGESEFRNGQPNSVNMLLWNWVIDDFASDIQTNCSQSSVRIGLLSQVRDTINEICKWPNSDAKSETAMRNFWLAFMSYDAPPEEFDAWKEFFLSSSYKDRPASETVRAMTLAILYNPHFLLRK